MHLGEKKRNIFEWCILAGATDAVLFVSCPFFSWCFMLPLVVLIVMHFSQITLHASTNFNRRRLCALMLGNYWLSYKSIFMERQRTLLCIETKFSFFVRFVVFAMHRNSATLIFDFDIVLSRSNYNQSNRFFV